MVVADTDILIGAIRGNKIAQQLLLKYSSQVHISAITQMELYVGTTDKAKRLMLDKMLKNYTLVPLSKSIGELASTLIKTYNTPNRSLYLPDSLIAATCMDKAFHYLRLTNQTLSLSRD